MPIIELKNVSYTYDGAEKPALKDVSLDIDEGQFVAVLGANGSGKSTLAKLVNALYRPTSGEVTVCGVTAADDDSAYQLRRACGMVFQNPDNQLVATIVEEDVAFGLENLGVPPESIRKLVDRALEAVGMSEYARSAPHMLSGGQKQRIAIAGVLAMMPSVIIFDESTAMLDPAGREEIFSLVRRLNRERDLTIVWITHFMEEAAQCDRVIVMDKGAIRKDGVPRDVFVDTELLHNCGLEAPEMTLLARELIARGISLPANIMTVDEMVVELCRLKPKA